MSMAVFQELLRPKNIVEQVVGDIADEHDRDDTPPDFVKHSEAPLLLETSGRMSIRKTQSAI